MSLESLKVALQTASALLRPGQAHYPALFEDDGATPRKVAPNWLLDPIRIEIENTGELQRLFQRNLHTPGSSGQASPWHIANASVHRLFEKVDPERIIADLLNLAQAKTCNNWNYIGCYSGGLSSKFELSSDVTVTPAEIAPPSRARELIFGIDRWGRRIFNDGLPNFKPNIALLISEQVEIFSEDEETDISKLRSVEEKAQRAIQALTLSSDYPLVRSWQVSWLDHPSVSYEGFGGWGASGSLEGPPQPRPWSQQPKSIEPKLAQDLYSKLASLPRATKPPVDLAIDRLRRSRAHISPADIALDLGIACEIILLHGIGSTSELRYRLSLRGAHLLDEAGQNRPAVFRSFQKLYDARSQAAHAGTLEPKLAELLPKFDELCSAAIRKIVDVQQFPDWEELTLGKRRT